MKKLLIFVFALLPLLMGCAYQKEEEPLSTSAIIDGTVTEIFDDERFNMSSGLGTLSIRVNSSELQEKIDELEVGDEVRIYYSGLLIETYPAQPHHVTNIRRK